MTAPTVTRLPGFGDEIRQGLAPLINALRFRQQQQQVNQQQQLQQQQLQIQEMAQRNTERERANENIFQLMDIFGPDILEDPAVIQIVERAELNAPRLRTQFQKRQQQAQKQEEDRIDALLIGVPEQSRDVYKTAIGLAESIGVKGAQVFLQEGLANLGEFSEEEEAPLRAAGFGPILDSVGLTVAQKREEIARRSIALTQIRQQEGPAFKQKLQNALTQARTEAARTTRTINLRKLAAGDLTPGEHLRSMLALVNIVERTINFESVAFLIAEGVGGLTEADINDRDTLVRKIFGEAVFNIWKQIPAELAGRTGITPPETP